MNTENATLLTRLVRAESEQEVVSILREEGYWDNSLVWQDYGGISDNFGTSGSQQASPECALVEKIVNGIDAVLMRECFLNGIPPEDKTQAPRSNRAAVEKFFEVRDGALETLLRPQRAKLAENVVLVATGSKDAPCIHIIDRGEGQTPGNFPDTFLSLHKGNKIRIPFVQGRFNMGGTGVHLYCGRHGLQLVASRRHPDLPDKLKKRPGESDPRKDEWGFTVVRMDPPDEDSKNPVLRYLAPKGEVLSCGGNALALVPGSSRITGKPPDPYSFPLEWGTFVKLFDYKLPGHLRTNIRLGLYFRLSALMPRCALPIRMVECRPFETERFDTTLSGLEVRFAEDSSNRLEGDPLSIEFSVEENKFVGQIFVLAIIPPEKDSEGKKRRPKKPSTAAYVANEGVLFVIDGQTQGHIERSMFKSEEMGLGHIADSLIVLLDCSHISPEARWNMFMTSRDRLRDSELTVLVRKEIRRVLGAHKTLRDINNKRHREEALGRISDSKLLDKTLRDLVKVSPGISFVLNDGVGFQHPFDLRGVETQQRYVGKFWPTHFELASPTEKSVPQGSHFKMFYETDAENNYFGRPNEPGVFRIVQQGHSQAPEHKATLENGRFTLAVNLPRGSKVGEHLCYETQVTDKLHEGEAAFTSKFCVSVADLKPKSGIKGSRTAPRSDIEGSRRKGPEQRGLPEVREIRRVDWGEKYNEYSALDAIATESGHEFIVNMDNVFLLSEIKRRAGTPPEVVQEQFKTGMVLLGLSLLQKDPRVAIRLHDAKNLGTDDEKPIITLIPDITRALAPVIIAMMRDLQ